MALLSSLDLHWGKIMSDNADLPQLKNTTYTRISQKTGGKGEILQKKIPQELVVEVKMYTSSLSLYNPHDAQTLGKLHTLKILISFADFT